MYDQSIEGTEQTTQEQMDQAAHVADAMERLVEDGALAVASGEATEAEAVAGIVEAIDAGALGSTDPTGFGDDVPTNLEEEAMMAADAAKTGSDQAAGAPASADSADSQKAYLAFIKAVRAHGEALGLKFLEQKGFYQFAAGTGHRLYVAKQGRGVTRIDTTLPRGALVINGKDISLPLSKPNGRIACHVDPTVSSVNAALSVLASFGTKIDPPRRPVAKAA